MLNKTLILLASILLFAACGRTDITAASDSTDDSKIYIEAFTIAASVGENGKLYSGGTAISSSSITVGKDSNKSFVVTPNTGNLIDHVLVDGVAQGPIETLEYTYEFSNIQTNHTIEAQFKTRTTWADVTAAIATADCDNIRTTLNEFSLTAVDYCFLEADPNTIKMNIMMVLGGICPANVLTCSSANLYAQMDGCLGNDAAACVTVRRYVMTPYSCNLNEAIEDFNCIP